MNSDASIGTILDQELTPATGIAVTMEIGQRFRVTDLQGLQVVDMAVFNAAKEQALDDFIAGRIGFTQMAPRVEMTLEALSGRAGFGDDAADLETVLDWDREARGRAAA